MTPQMHCLQLNANVEDDYASLAVVETNCIELEASRNAQKDDELSIDKRFRFINLQQTLFDKEYQDASLTLQPLAARLQSLDSQTRETSGYMPFTWSPEPVASLSDAISSPRAPALQGDSPRRRGRGARRNNAYWKTLSQDSMLVSPYHTLDILVMLIEHTQNVFKSRDCLFADSNGKVIVPALADLDSGLGMSGSTDYPIMSLQHAKEIGRFDDISTKFEDPGLHDVSGNPTPMIGIIKDVAFRLKGCSDIFRRDFYVSDLFGNEERVGVDIMLGAKFMQDHLALVFQPIWAGAKSFGNEIKSVFTRILESGGSVKVKAQKIFDCVRFNAARIFGTSSSACSGPGPWAWWNAKSKEDPKEREERERQQAAQRLHSARVELGRRTQEVAAHGNNAGPHGQSPTDNSGSSQARSNAH
ncbi:hypothetical protein PG984_010895 [Apiospora sp. TS-2023a]